MNDQTAAASIGASFPGSPVERAQPTFSDGASRQIVMQAINRAKRKFFLRPGYMVRHVGDVARLAMTKQAIVWQVLSRTVFGADIVDTAKGRRPNT